MQGESFNAKVSVQKPIPEVLPIFFLFQINKTVL